MIDLIKWFWVNINFRKWTFEGHKLNNPLIIIIRLIMIIPIKLAGLLLALCYFVAFEKYQAEDIIKDHVFYY